MDCTATDNANRKLLEAAWSQDDLGTWQNTVFEVLECVGYDVAFLKTVVRGFTFASRGMERAVLAKVQTNWPVYSRELLPVTLSAQREGVAVDSEIYGPSRRRMAYFRDLVEPQKGNSGLYAHLSVGGREVGGLMLGRTGRGFSLTEQNHVRELLASLSLGAAAMSLHVSGGVSAWPSVSTREREVLSLLQLGYTNPEIARALGTSPNTVRNQVASLLRKLGASTRSELVSLTLR